MARFYVGGTPVGAIPIGVADVDSEALLFFKGAALSWFSQIGNFPAGGTIAQVDFDGLRFKMIRSGNYAYPVVASTSGARWFTITYYRGYSGSSAYDGNKAAEISTSDVALTVETNFGYLVGGNCLVMMHDITLQRAYQVQCGAHGLNRDGYADIGYLHARRLF
ncbi:MAG: hypothetical protein LBK54_10245 [Propionibacteriaceae bacterium]|jgi:hypothetical protein|nr:hypothetical protein [Propionibacteriaceae bacterium]